MRAAASELQRVGRRRVPDPRRRRRLARRHGSRSPTGWRSELDVRRGAAPQRRRPASGRPTSPASRARSTAAPSWSSRWTPTSHTTRVPRRPARGGQGRGPRARLALRARRRRARLGSAAAADQPRRRTVRAARSCGSTFSDLTGGFKCIRREVLEAIDLESVRAEGYVFQIEVTYRALLAGFTVREVPIVFRDRTEGSSKMSTRIAVEAMWLVPRLRRSARAAIERARGEAPRSRPPMHPLAASRPNVIAMSPKPRADRPPGILVAMSVQQSAWRHAADRRLRPQHTRRCDSPPRAQRAARRSRMRLGQLGLVGVLSPDVISIAAAQHRQPPAGVGPADPRLARRAVRQRQARTSHVGGLIGVADADVRRPTCSRSGPPSASRRGRC